MAPERSVPLRSGPLTTRSSILGTAGWRWRHLGLSLAVACATGPSKSGKHEPPAATSVRAAAPACAQQGRLPAGLSEHVVRSSGVERRLLVHAPAALDAAAPAPVVFTLHGSGGTPEGQLEVSGLAALADRERFLLVAPAAVGGRWNVPPEPGKADDVRFISDAIDALGGLACVDTGRVYSTGFSGGGRMSSQLACELSERIAAIAAIGGLRFPSPCSAARSVPIVAFHGTADTVNPYEGGGQPYWGTGIEHAMAGWAKHNGCTARAVVSVMPGVDEIRHDGACAEVVLYRIDDFGHSWPGVVTAAPGTEPARTTANDVLWRFFQSHPLPGAAP